MKSNNMIEVHVYRNMSYREASSISDSNVWGIKDETLPMQWRNCVIRTVNGHHVGTSLSRTLFDEESILPE